MTREANSNVAEVPKKKRKPKKNTKIQIKFTSTDGEKPMNLSRKSKCGIQSPLMPSSATATENAISLTYELPRTMLSPELQDPSIPKVLSSSNTPVIYSLDQSLPVLTVLKNDTEVVESYISYSTIQTNGKNDGVQNSAWSTTEVVASDTIGKSSSVSEQIDHVMSVDDTQMDQTQHTVGSATSSISDTNAKSSLDFAIKTLCPVSLGEIPTHMLATPPPSFQLQRESSPAPVPSVSSTHDDDLIDSLSSSFEMPLYTLSASDWSKIQTGGSESANEVSASHSSFLDQSWDETQTLPLFEPTLDFETLMCYE